MFKALLIATNLMLVTGCTMTYKIDYLVTTSDPRGITMEDVGAVSASFVNDAYLVPAVNPATTQSDMPRSFYLSRHKDAWEILNIETDNAELILSVTRLTKYIGRFSDNWKDVFKFKMENNIKRTIDKTVTLEEVSD